jgi:phage tail-like protein
MPVELELPAVYIDGIVLDPAPTRPALINRDPEPDDVQVPLVTSIRFDLTDVGSDGIDPAATQVFVAGVLAFAGGAFQPSFDNERSTASQLGLDTWRFVLGPPAPFSSLQQVEVRVVARTVGGAFALDATWSFVCEDRTAPRVVGAQAREIQRVRLSFDEPVIQNSPGAAADALNHACYAITHLSTPAVDVTVVAVEAVSSTAVDLITDDALTPAASYSVAVASVTDRFGNAIEAPNNTATFTGFVPAAPPGRAFNLYDLLPQINRREDQTGDLQHFLACLQEVTNLLLYDVDRFTDLIDPDLAPELVLDLMLAELGNPFRFELQVADKRRLLNVLVAIYREKGTGAGIVNAIRFFLGLEVGLTAYAGEALRLGESKLGEDWILGPSNAFASFAFEVVVPRALEPDERVRLRQVVEYMKPAQTHFARLVEPTLPQTIDHLELGLSELGETWTLH